MIPQRADRLGQRHPEQPEWREPPDVGGQRGEPQRRIPGLEIGSAERGDQADDDGPVRERRGDTPLPRLPPHRREHQEGEGDDGGGLDQHPHRKHAGGDQFPPEVPSPAGRSRGTGRPGQERQRYGHRQPHQHVVVPAAHGVEEEHRIPRHQGHGERSPSGPGARGDSGHDQDERDSCRAGQSLECPHVGDVAAEQAGDRGGEHRERGPVHGERLPPRRADQREDRVRPEGGRDGQIGVGVVQRLDPSVDRVAVHVPGEEQRKQGRHGDEHDPESHDQPHREHAPPGLPKREEERSRDSEHGQDRRRCPPPGDQTVQAQGPRQHGEGRERSAAGGKLRRKRRGGHPGDRRHGQDARHHRRHRDVRREGTTPAHRAPSLTAGSRVRAGPAGRRDRSRRAPLGPSVDRAFVAGRGRAEPTG